MVHNTKMYICLEAKNGTGKSVYMIYSVDTNDFCSNSPPMFTEEIVIRRSVPSMGCGLFGSKIVLAGGLVPGKDEGDEEKYKGLITFDITSQQVSREDMSMMRGGKAAPLLFPLNNKLYALDTIGYLHRRSFEAYYPNQKHWHRLDDPYSLTPNSSLDLSLSEGISRFSWFVVGHCLFISLPNHKITYYHHAKHRYKIFYPWLLGALPFQGMAITYYHHNFKQDVVLISFSKGLVEGRRFRFFKNHLETPVLIFDTKTYSQHDGDMSGYFADFGFGKYCLTTFDDVNMHIYMFEISRHQTKNGTLGLKLLKVNMHKYRYTDLSEADFTGSRFAGCFAPQREKGWRKEILEEALYDFPLRSDYDEIEEVDIAPYTKCCHNSDSDDDMEKYL